jgi:hypothetical protein
MTVALKATICWFPVYSLALWPFLETAGAFEPALTESGRPAEAYAAASTCATCPLLLI